MEIIDTHQHLWDLERLELPWIEHDSVLNHSYRTADYLQATGRHSVGQAVYMEVDVAPHCRPSEAQLVIELCQSADHPTAAAVIGGHPGTPGFRDYVAEFGGNDYVKGVRQILHPPAFSAGHCLVPEFVADVQWLGRQGLCFDICIRPEELSDAAELAARCPETRFVLDHCGNPNVRSGDETLWKRGIDAVVALENVVGKISGLIVTADPQRWSPAVLAPWVNHTLDAFGPQRVMFGGDWPVCTQTAPLHQWIDALLEIVAPRSPEQQRLLFHDNAAKFYGL